MYDAIVVGARCAGSATALLLARAGHRVLLVDRAAFPRDTLSTLYIQQRGGAHLRRWGLLDRVAALCPALDHVSYTVGDVRLEGRSRPVDSVAAAYAPRRHTLDTLLAQAAVEAGAEFRQSCTVEDLLRDADGRVTGVRLRTRGGRTEERAHLVIGADGMRSTVAELAGAATLVEDAPKTCVYYTFWAGAADHFELYEAEGRWIGAVPTNDGQTLVQAYFPQREFDRVRADAMTAYLDNVRAAAPGLHERMLAGGRTERLMGTGDQRNFFREAAGPGWALVGDAGHQRDSITARGITHAFIQAQLLADRTAGVLDDRPRLTAALQAYARERYDALIDDYHDTLAMARLSVPEHRMLMLREVADDPARTEDFFSAMGGAPQSATADRGAQSAAQAIRWMKAQREARRVRT
ncbi:NAD(P)/FAD-dependent oxidoreductase [Actinacidiphila sp. ITFR-21]|uniref:NAD(P)/FAD-dependent oxidoreductase n=1 Tax=Actinacidiphila sp. ITFR-21 TaxID=3075199 RepID=UPI00288AAFB7|nr:NAD(P)/FAD-dependent oxidoreductase [Streptomyces sp. ITFR-21]WNI18968.1 NAD(P)/FAD-dependent oxidoreductase [Streptomyces sp. ITFR-21]